MFGIDNLDMLFDAETGWVRDVRIGGQIVVQAIYPAVRDDKWQTIPVKIEGLRMEEEAGRFAVHYRATTLGEGPGFSYEIAITGTDADGVKVAFTGKATKAFATNRIGLCVLHPAPGCDGAEYLAKLKDSSASGRFPAGVSASLVQAGMHGLEYTLGASGGIVIAFVGDVFDMEDQRNFTDASFKSYSTAGGKGQPWQIGEDDLVAHAVILKAKPGLPAHFGTESPWGEVSFHKTSGLRGLPAIGIAAASHGEPVSQEALERLQIVAPDHLRLDFRLGEVPLAAALSLGAKQAEALKASLIIGLHLNDDPEQDLRMLSNLLGQIKPAIAAWLVFPPGGKQAGGRWLEMVRASLVGYDPDIPFVIGTPGGFVSLNRMASDMAQGDGLVFGANPLVHVEDNRSMVANLPGMRAAAERARELAGNHKVWASPVAFRFAGSASLANAIDGLPGDVDLRQMSLLGAAWTVGAIQALAEGGVDAITLFETTGWRGLVERQKGPPLPTRFPSQPGMAFPLYHVLADVSAWAGHQRLECKNVGGGVAAFGCDGVEGYHMLVANLEPEPRVLLVQTDSGVEHAWARFLDERNFVQAATAPLEYREESLVLIQKNAGGYLIPLLPYAVVRLDEARAEMGTE